MTEYDYSPEAYERYLTTQQRITKWVHKTEEHRPEFVNEGGPSRPSFLQRLTQRRKSNSYHDQPRHRRGSSSSISSRSSSTASYTASPPGPGPMPFPSIPPFLHGPQATSPPVMYSQQRPSHSRHHSSSHHHSHSSTYRAPVYLASPPTSPPEAYPYPYGAATSPGQATSPGSYVYPQRPGVSSAGTPGYITPATGYFPPSQTYPPPPPPQAYGQTMPPQYRPQTAPLPNTYPFYGSQSQPLASPPLPYPQTSAYPPAIYPLTPYGPQQQQQQMSQRPVFYQRFFSGSESKKRRSR